MMTHGKHGCNSVQVFPPNIFGNIPLLILKLPISQTVN